MSTHPPHDPRHQGQQPGRPAPQGQPGYQQPHPGQQQHPPQFQQPQPQQPQPQQQPAAQYQQRYSQPQHFAPQGQPPRPYPEQRAYAPARFAAPVTQEMRQRSQVHHYSGGQVQGGWTQQATQAFRRRQDPTAGADLARLIVGIIVACLLGLGLLGILLLAAISMRGVGLVIILLSLLPLSVIILTVIWFDRWKPQPKLILGLCVLWGAVAAVIIVLITQLMSIYALRTVGIDASGDVFGAVVMAPIFEEGAKGIFLVVLVLAARKYFEGPLDGWMYGSLIGAGFAFTENLLYLGGVYAEHQAPGLLLTFAMRCVVSPLLHSTFTGLAGMAIGFAARRGAWWMTILMWIPGYLLGAFLHGLWNGTATLTQNMNVVLSLAVTAVLSFFIAALWFGCGLFLRHDEAKQARVMLGDYANAGWMTHNEVQMLGTWAGRRTGKRWASQFPGGLREMKTMIKAAASLASIRERLLAHVGGRSELDRERYELDALTDARSRLMAAAAQPTWRR